MRLASSTYLYPSYTAPGAERGGPYHAIDDEPHGFLEYMKADTCLSGSRFKKEEELNNAPSVWNTQGGSGWAGTVAPTHFTRLSRRPGTADWVAASLRPHTPHPELCSIEGRGVIPASRSRPPTLSTANAAQFRFTGSDPAEQFRRSKHFTRTLEHLRADQAQKGRDYSDRFGTTAQEYGFQAFNVRTHQKLPWANYDWMKSSRSDSGGLTSQQRAG